VAFRQIRGRRPSWPKFIILGFGGGEGSIFIFSTRFDMGRFSSSSVIGLQLARQGFAFENRVFC
jgi:hypothetical protein